MVSDQDYLYRQREKFKETAFYGELTWHATDSVDFTGGFRHFRDESDTRVQQTTGLYSSIIDSSDSSGSESDSYTLFKGNVSWKFSPSNQLYATISEGYRRGGANGTPTTGKAIDPVRYIGNRSSGKMGFALAEEAALRGATGTGHRSGGADHDEGGRSSCGRADR